MGRLERYTITLLVKRPDAPHLDEQAAAALQDAHMSHLADLHEAGHLLAAGPLKRRAGPGCGGCARAEGTLCE